MQSEHVRAELETLEMDDQEKRSAAIGLALALREEQKRRRALPRRRAGPGGRY
jgi:hypothetical protein